MELRCLPARSNAGRAFPSRLPWCGRSERRRAFARELSIRRNYHSPSYPIRSHVLRSKRFLNQAHVPLVPHWPAIPPVGGRLAFAVRVRSLQGSIGADLQTARTVHVLQIATCRAQKGATEHVRTHITIPWHAGIEKVRKSWGWFLVLGVALAVLGVSCIAFDVTATFASVLVFGWLLLISGVFQLVHAFRTGTWSGTLLNLLSALFRGFTGFLLIRYPIMGAEALTVVLASFFIVAGLFRAIASAMVKLPRWGWVVFSGAITTVLGFLLLAQMPISGIWFIGFAIGVDLIFDGIATIGFAAAIHRVPKPAAFAAA